LHLQIWLHFIMKIEKMEQHKYIGLDLTNDATHKDTNKQKKRKSLGHLLVFDVYLTGYRYV